MMMSMPISSTAKNRYYNVFSNISSIYFLVRFNLTLPTLNQSYIWGNISSNKSHYNIYRISILSSCKYLFTYNPLHQPTLWKYSMSNKPLEILLSISVTFSISKPIQVVQTAFDNKSSLTRSYASNLRHHVIFVCSYTRLKKWYFCPI